MLLNKQKIKAIIVFLLVITIIQATFAQICDYTKSEVVAIGDKITELREEIKDLNKKAAAREVVNRVIELGERELSYREEAIKLRDLEVKDLYERGEITRADYQDYVLRSSLEKKILGIEKEINYLEGENLANRREISLRIREVNEAYKQVEQRLDQKRQELQQKGFSEAEIKTQIKDLRKKLMKETGLVEKLSQLEQKYNILSIQKLKRIRTEKANELAILDSRKSKQEVVQDYFGEKSYEVTEEGRIVKESLDKISERLTENPQEIRELLSKAELSNIIETRKVRAESKEKLNTELEKVKEELKRDPTNEQLRDRLVDLEKKLRLEELIEAKQKEVEQTVDPVLKQKKIEELRELEQVEEIVIRTGNTNFDTLVNRVLKEFTLIKNREFKSRGIESLFNINKAQVETIMTLLKADTTKGVELALAGGKTSVIAPVMMELGTRLYGRKGLFALSDGKSVEAFNEIAPVMTEMGRKVFHFKNAQGQKLESILEEIREADMVITEAGELAFMEAALKQRVGTPEELKLQKQILEELTNNVQVLFDEAQITLDSGRHYRIGSEGEPLSKKVIKETAYIGGLLKKIGVLKRIRGQKWTVDRERSLKTIEGLQQGKFKYEVLEKLAERIANDKGLTKKQVLEIFESKQSKTVEKGKVEEVLDLLDTINEFAEVIRKKPGSDYGYDPESGLVKPAYEGNLQVNQQLSNPRSAAALEYVGALVAGKPPALLRVKSGGLSVSATMEDFLARIKAAGNSQVYFMTGTIGQQRVALELMNREVVRISDVQKKFLGYEEDGVWIEGQLKKDSIEGIEERNPAEVFINHEVFGKANRAAITLTEKGQLPEDFVDQVLSNSKFKQHSVIYRGADGKFKYREFDPKTGKHKTEVEINSQKASEIMRDKSKKTLLVLGEGASVGTNIPMLRDVPWAHSTSKEVSLDLQLQAFGRAERIKGEIPEEVRVFVRGLSGKIHPRELVKILEPNQRAGERNKAYEAITFSVDRVMDKFLTTALEKTEFNTPREKVLKDALLDYHTRGAKARNLEIEVGQLNSLEAIKNRIKFNVEFAKQLLNNKNFVEQLTVEERKILESLTEAPTELRFASKKQRTGRSVLDANNYQEFAEIFSETVTKESIPDKTTGRDESRIIERNLERTRQTVNDLKQSKQGKQQEIERLRAEFNNKLNNLARQTGVSAQAIMNALENEEEIKISENLLEELRVAMLNLRNKEFELNQINQELTKAEISIIAFEDALSLIDARKAAVKTLKAQGYKESFINHYLDAALSALNIEQRRELANLENLNEFITEEEKQENRELAEEIFFEGLRNAIIPEHVTEINTQEYTPQIKELLNTQKEQSKKIIELARNLRTIIGSNLDLKIERVDLLQELSKLGVISESLENKINNLEEIAESLNTFSNAELKSEQLNLLGKLKSQQIFLQAQLQNLYSTADVLKGKVEQTEQLNKILQSSTKLFKEVKENKAVEEILSQLIVKQESLEELQLELLNKQDELETHRKSLQEFLQRAADARVKGDEEMAKIYEEEANNKKEEITKLEEKIKELKSKLKPEEIPEVTAEEEVEEVPAELELPIDLILPQSEVDKFVEKEAELVC